MGRGGRQPLKSNSKIWAKKVVCAQKGILGAGLQLLIKAVQNGYEHGELYSVTDGLRVYRPEILVQDGTIEDGSD